jgi:hypothetical protein
MYAIYTKTRRNPYFIEDDEQGKRLAEQWLNNKLPARVKLGAIAIESGQIKGIESNVKPEENEDWFEKALSEKKTNLTNYVKETNEDFEAHTRNRQLSSTDELASDLSVARFVWLSATGTTIIPKDAAERIVERQRAYLEEHPDVTRANPICYRDIIKENTDTRWKNPVVARLALTLAERIVSADKFALTKVS